ncbi:20611_t:CDS:2, partial [Gigaspora margarita]
NETPEMWCSRIRYPFRTLLENNPKYFSKNGFIYMTERSRDRRFMVKKPKRHLAYSNPFQKKGERNVSLLSSDEVDEIFMNYSIYPQRSYRVYNMENKFREKLFIPYLMVQKLSNRLGELLTKRVWNMVRNDSTPDEKKFLDVILRKIKNSYTHQQHDLRSAKIIAIINKGYNYPSPGEYKEYYLPNKWIERKKEQLNNRLSLVSYIVAFIELHRHGYRIVEYSGWTYMLKWLLNPEYYRINESSNERIVRSLEYARYMCKMHSKSYPCDSLKINYFETKYLYILGEEINIDFLDSNNNC